MAFISPVFRHMVLPGAGLHEAQQMSCLEDGSHFKTSISHSNMFYV